MAIDLLKDDSSIVIADREPYATTRLPDWYREYWQHDPPRYKSMWLINTMTLSLQSIMQEVYHATDIKEHGVFIDFVRRFEELFKEIDKDIILNDSSGRREPRVRGTPRLGGVEIEVNPIINVPPKTGRRYPLKIRARMRAKFEAGPVRIDYPADD